MHERAQKTNPQYRAVVIGCGQIGSRFTTEARSPGVHSHAQAYREHPRTELVGVSDINSDHLQAAVDAWNVTGGSDPVELCHQLKPDMISICTPDASHYSLVESILNESPPRVLFVEKPLALDVKDCEQLIELAEKRGVALAVNYSRRFSPAFQSLRRELQEGLHGRPILARILYSKGLFRNGTHAIDLMRFWLGEPIRATGYAAAWGPEGDETYSGDLWFENECRVRIEAIDDRVATVFEVDVLTERSRWSFWTGGSRWDFFEVRESPAYAGYRSYVPTNRAAVDPLFVNPIAECLKHAVTNLVDHLELKTPLLCNGADGLAAVKWAQRLRGIS
jgi:predicted dehydrogenase